VSEEPLAEVASEMQLGELLFLGSGELKTGGFRRQSILADAFEALCGALFLDGGLDTVRAHLMSKFESRIAALPEPATLKDAKTKLQEHLQANGRSLPVYAVKRTSGEPHAQVFLVSCAVPHVPIETEGEGPSRRRAEQVAAQAALKALGLND
jgi:ribonuclease-3